MILLARKDLGRFPRSRSLSLQWSKIPEKTQVAHVHLGHPATHAAPHPHRPGRDLTAAFFSMLFQSLPRPPTRETLDKL